MKIWRPLRALFSKDRQHSKDKETLIGRIAQSVSGRDKGRIYIITGQTGGIYVDVSDGKIRTVSQPKRKNIRHLLISDERVPDGFLEKGRISADDAMIASFIAARTDI